jgi:mannose-1-phosphate guanylyltransferase/phosphomannomutase
MRRVVESVDTAAGYAVDTTDGVRIVGPDGSWVLVLPDPSEAVTHLWAEGADLTEAHTLLRRWAEVVESP